MSLPVSVEVIEAPPVSVEVVEEAGVLVVEIDRPAAVDVVDVIHPGPQGPLALRERRHAWSAPFSYCGTAPAGTPEGTASWTVTRIEIGSTGAVLAAGTATDVTWTGRTGHTYS